MRYRMNKHRIRFHGCDHQLFGNTLLKDWQKGDSARLQRQITLILEGPELLQGPTWSMIKKFQVHWQDYIQFYVSLFLPYAVPFASLCCLYPPQPCFVTRAGDKQWYHKAILQISPVITRKYYN